MDLFTIVIIVTVVSLLGFSVLFGAPYLPTRKKWAKEALELAKVGKNDTVVDLGSGDGVILKLVAEQGAYGIGYEISPVWWLISKIRLMKYGGHTLVKLSNYWHIDLPIQTTVVYAFCVERDAKKLEKYLIEQAEKVKAQKLRVVAFGFSLPTKKPTNKNKVAYLYEI